MDTLRTAPAGCRTPDRGRDPATPGTGGALARLSRLPETASAESLLVALRGVIHEGELTRRLAEIAFVGAFCGHAAHAEALFNSLRCLCPGNPYVELGQALACALAGEPAEGLALLERIPPSGDALHGMVPLCAAMLLSQAGHRAAADRKFSEAQEQGGQAAELARAWAGAGCR